MENQSATTYTGHGNCRRCGDEIPPYRYLCDVCRAVPDFPCSPYNPNGVPPSDWSRYINTKDTNVQLHIRINAAGTPVYPVFTIIARAVKTALVVEYT